jgi:IPT/TIG domain
MPQQILNPVGEYGRSGSVLLLNPTDRRAPIDYGQTAAALRSPAVIRGTAPTYTAPAAATVSTVSPNTGGVAGGTAVTLTGTGFAEATGVTFGGVAATSVVIVSSTSITCVSPANSAGAKDVVVLDPNGNGTKTGGFTYS